MVSFALIFDSFVYGLFSLVYFFSHPRMQHRPEIIFGSNLYWLIIPALLIAASAHAVRERLWEIQKARVSSTETFYRGILFVTILTMSMLDVIGVIGVFVFLSTGNMRFFLIMLLISFSGKFLNYPDSNFIEHKRKEIPLDLKKIP